MLLEKSRNTQVTAEAVQGNYTFRTEYRVSGKSELMNINCQVYKTTEGDQQEYVGNMSLESGNKNICIRETEQVSELLPTFESIITEVKASLVAEPATEE